MTAEEERWLLGWLPDHRNIGGGRFGGPVKDWEALAKWLDECQRQRDFFRSRMEALEAILKDHGIDLEEVK